MHDDRLDAVDLRRQRDALRVVAGRRAHHAAAPLLVGELRELVQRAADLVRAGALEDLGLQADVEAGRLAEHPRRQQRRVMDVRRDLRVRGLEHVAREPMRSLSGARLHRRHHDLDHGARRHEAGPHRRAGGEVLAEERAILLVHLRELRQIGEVDEAVDDVGGRVARRRQRRADPGQRLPRLRRGVAGVVSGVARAPRRDTACGRP